ncbi:MAG TPA: hypothetical protein VF306_03915 [Pirellulales bacterium]
MAVASPNKWRALVNVRPYEDIFGARAGVDHAKRSVRRCAHRRALFWRQLSCELLRRSNPRVELLERHDAAGLHIGDALAYRRSVGLSLKFIEAGLVKQEKQLLSLFVSDRQGTDMAVKGSPLLGRNFRCHINTLADRKRINMQRRPDRQRHPKPQHGRAAIQRALADFHRNNIPQGCQPLRVKNIRLRWLGERNRRLVGIWFDHASSVTRWGRFAKFIRAATPAARIKIRRPV